MAQLTSIWQEVAHSQQKCKWLSFQNYCDPTSLHTSAFCLSTLTKDELLFPAGWGAGRKLLKVYARAFQDEAPLGEPRARPASGIFLPSTCPETFLMISHAQSTSHTLFRSCFYSRKQIIWRLHYFYDEKRALDVNHMRAFTNVHNHSRNLVFHLGKEKRISCGFFF